MNLKLSNNEPDYDSANFIKTKKPCIHKAFQLSAENVGFEPTVPCGTPVFKTGAFDHSANSPGQKY